MANEQTEGVFQGVIIEESLRDVAVLTDIRITSTEVESVTEKHQTPWLTCWTLHTVEIEAGEAPGIAEKISRSMDTRDNWYADFKNNKLHFVIFRDKIFCVELGNSAQYEEVVKYGLSLGIPSYQLDFAPEVKQWIRPNQ